MKVEKTGCFSLNILFLSAFISCIWPWGWLHTCVCMCAFVRACISITFVSADKSWHSPLFMRVISCMWLCVYVPDQAYLHPSFTAIQIIYSPPGLQHGFWPAALYQQLGCTAFPRLPLQSLALYHARHTAGLLQAQNTSSPQPAERSRGRLEDGLRVQEDPY